MKKTTFKIVISILWLSLLFFLASCASSPDDIGKSVADTWTQNPDGVWNIGDETFHSLIPVPDWLNWGGRNRDKGMTNTKIYKFSHNGKRFKVQLWKGYYPPMPPCTPFALGAEVGIYFENGIDWLPAQDHKADMEYTLSDKQTGAAYFSMKKNTWWLNGWIPGEVDAVDAKGKRVNLKVRIQFNDPNMQSAFEEVFGQTEVLWE